jgi:hypothetical protein
MPQLQYNESVENLRRVKIQLFEADGETPQTGADLSIQILKAGKTSYKPIQGSWVENESGTYEILLSREDLDTLGQAVLKVSVVGESDRFMRFDVIPVLGGRVGGPRVVVTAGPVVGPLA